MTNKKPTYKEAVEEIDLILHQIENEELEVDELSGKVKRVSELLRHCKDKLHKTEEEVDKILKSIEE
jgi:exodeoxyribonuclease VII small subunit